MAPKRRLQIVERAVGIGQAFHRSDFPPIGLHRQRETGTLCDAIDQDGARATHAMLAAHMHPRRTQVVTQKIREQASWFDVGAALAAVEGQTQRMHHVAVQYVHRGLLEARA